MKTRPFRLCPFLALGALVITLSPGAPASAAVLAGSVPPSSALPQPAIVSAALKSAPVMFVENVGQFGAGTRFQVRSANGTVYLADDALWFTILEKPKPEASSKQTPPPQRGSNAPQQNAPLKGVNLKLSFVGANPHPTLEPFNRLDTHVSYFIGSDPNRWHPNVPVWGGVRYKDLYPGIDLEVTSEKGKLLQRVVAQPGANLTAVQLRVDGAERISLQGEQLVLTTAIAAYQLPLLQLVGGADNNMPRPEVEGSQVTTPFSGARAGSAQPAIPASSDLLYSSFLGGGDFDGGYAIAVDSTGAAYVTGESGSADFPTTAGAFQTTKASGYDDAFVTKLNAVGSALVYSTFLGGADFDGGSGIAVDSTGEAYITGNTWSNDFPITAAAFQKTKGGYSDAFVTKLDSAGSVLAYSTYLGGGDFDSGYGIAVGDMGAAYITGFTQSTDFPTTTGAFQTAFGGGVADAFVSELMPAGSLLAYSTFLGGSSPDQGAGIAVDGTGAAYTTGHSYSTDFPTTAGAFQTTLAGGDAFVTKLNAAGSALVYSTFLGGNQIDWGYSIAVDDTGAAYVTGNTWSTDFPTSAGAFQTVFGGGVDDAFVTKLNAAGSALVYSSFLGGSNEDDSYSIAVDGTGASYITGMTSSTNLPTTAGAFQTNYGSGYDDTFVSKLSADGTALVYSTFLGGSDWEHGSGIALGTTSAAYVTGYTYSGDFPVTAGAFQTTLGGMEDAFVSKLAMVAPPKVEDSALRVQYNGWRGVSDSNASGGSYRISNVKNDSVTYTFKGTSVTWVTLTGPDQGKAQVLIDGASKGTASLYSATPHWQVQRTFGGLANKAHALVIKVLGTKNASSTGTSIAVDAFKVGSKAVQESACAIKYNTWACLANSNASGGSLRYSGLSGRAWHCLSLAPALTG
jgi:Beta-propeller repeat